MDMATVYQRTLSSHMILAWHIFHLHCYLTSCAMVGIRLSMQRVTVYGTTVEKRDACKSGKAREPDCIINLLSLPSSCLLVPVPSVQVMQQDLVNVLWEATLPNRRNRAFNQASAIKYHRTFFKTPN
jgi:hypothetical protein